MEFRLSQPSKSLPSVLFLDQPFAAGMVHLWLREYFFEKGFTILGGKLPPWKENLLLSEYSDIDEDYLNELDWEEMIRHTVARLNGQYGYNLETKEEKSKIISCFKDYAKKMERQFSTHNVKAVVIFGNYRVETKLGAYFSHKYHVQLICIESFFLQNYFYLEPNSTQIANHHAFIQKWPFMRNLKVSREQLDALDILMRERESHGLLNDYISMPVASENLSSKLQKIKKCKGKVGLILGQVPYDAVIVNDLLAFPEQILFLRFVIEHFLMQCTSDDLIVCRLHPLEARQGNDTAKQLQMIFADNPQVLLLSGDDCNTYQIMSFADFGIVANSQSGLEMIYRDKPVLVCGNPYYAVEQFCLQATDKETIQVQLSKLLTGWCPSEKKLMVAKQYLCGLIFNHLCRRNKADVYQKLENIPGLSALQNQNTAKIIKQNIQKKLTIMPNAKVGRVELLTPDDILQIKSLLVVGVGSFAQYLVSSTKLDFTFCSDLPADCQLSVQHYPVQLLDHQLITKHQVILICWPKHKCLQLLAEFRAQDMQDKTFYRIEKSQKENNCEFRFCLIDVNCLEAL
jgi:capsule polysaccharide modification protein KpsS